MDRRSMPLSRRLGSASGGAPVKIETVLTRLQGVKPTGAKQWQAVCPAHDDHKPSLSITLAEDGKILLHCQAGCAFDAVCENLGISPAELFPDSQRRDADPSKPLAVYDYRDELGKLVYQVVRLPLKRFMQRRPGDNGEFIWDMKGVIRVPYRLPELVKTGDGDIVFVVEGERDADNVASLGLIVTTNSGGAGKWLDSYNHYFKGRTVALLGDNDEPGRKHVQQVAQALLPVAREVRVLSLPEGFKDISEYLDTQDSVEPEALKSLLLKWFYEAEPFEPESSVQPIIVRLSDVKALPIEWFWFNRIPLGMLTLLLGDAGLGKSFLTLYMASKISTGGTWPDGDGIPDNSAPLGSVVILSAEDDLAHVVRPRLDSLNADLSRIKSLEGVRIKDENGQECQEYFNLQHHIPALRKAVRSCKDCKVIIIDPLSAFLGGKIDSHKDSDVRSVLAPLVELAEENQIAIIAIMHLNKNISSKVVYRGMGSIAFTAAARTVWLVSTDPNDPDSKRRLLTPVKHNILIEPTGLAFELVDGKVVFENESITMSSEEALGGGSTVEAVVRDEAVVWLRDILTPDKSLASTELDKMAEAEGIKSRTLRRAKEKAGVTSYRLCGLAICYAAKSP